MSETNVSLSAGTDRPLTHEQISRRAQELWENYGRPTGRDEEIWLEAERKLRSELQANASTGPGSQGTSLADIAPNSPAPVSAAPNPLPNPKTPAANRSRAKAAPASNVGNASRSRAAAK